jgi:hypothetical protein
MMYGSKFTNNSTRVGISACSAQVKDAPWEQLVGEVEVNETCVGGLRWKSARFALVWVQIPTQQIP